MRKLQPSGFRFYRLLFFLMKNVYRFSSRLMRETKTRNVTRNIENRKLKHTILKPKRKRCLFEVYLSCFGFWVMLMVTLTEHVSETVCHLTHLIRGRSHGLTRENTTFFRPWSRRKELRYRAFVTASGAALTKNWSRSSGPMECTCGDMVSHGRKQNLVDTGFSDKD